MTVVLCGVGADTGNVRPVPRVDVEGRFEYVPIPETGATSESATYGTIDCRHRDGPLADLLDGIRPGSDGEWVTDPEAIRDQQVHRDPNFAALTYGEPRPGYVAKLRDLDPGDAVAFYGGFPSPDSAYKHRYLFGYFTVAESPVVVDPEMDAAEKAALLDRHPENAHAKRFAENGELYAQDTALTERPRSVVIVPGREPGGLLDRAIRLSDRREGPNYYMDEAVADVLNPRSGSDRGTHLGGFKPAVHCNVDSETFAAFLRRKSAV
ncbi:Nmad3 family putative nucleotide modification protein [Halosimplex sp. J119]